MVVESPANYSLEESSFPQYFSHGYSQSLAGVILKQNFKKARLILAVFYLESISEVVFFLDKELVIVVVLAFIDLPELQIHALINHQYIKQVKNYK